MSSKHTSIPTAGFGSNMDMIRSPVFNRAVQRAAEFKCLQALKAGKIRLVQEPRVGMPDKFIPRMDLVEDNASNKSTAVFELPGVKTGDITLQIRGGNLIVMGERRAPQALQNVMASRRALPHNPITAADSVAAGEMDTDLSATVTVHELRFGSFYRALPVPDGIKESDVTAALQDGMLTVTWPKTLARAAQNGTLPLAATSTFAHAAQ